MRTDTANYNGQKAFALIFGLGFIAMSTFALARPDIMTTNSNGQEVETTVYEIMPGFVIGTASLILFFWMQRNYFSIRMDDQGIVIEKANSDERLSWNDIEKIEEVEWLWKGTIFEVQPKELKRFYFHADKPNIDFNSMFDRGFKTKMAEFVSQKKRELGI